MGAIREVMEAAVNEAGGDMQKANVIVADKFGKLIDEGKITFADVSIRELFEATANYNGDVDLARVTAVSEAISSSAFPYITEKLIYKEMLAAHDIAMMGLDRIVPTIQMSNEKEDIAGLSAIDTLTEVIEGQPYEEGGVSEYYVQVKAKKFGRIISLTREMVLFDKTGEVVRRAKRIGENAGQWKHRFIVEALTDQAINATGESANYGLLWNGSGGNAIYANDHSSYFDGQTNDNLVSGALTFDNFASARALLRRMKNSVGDYVFVNPRHLVVPPELEASALILMQSTQKAGSANNDVNVFKGSADVIVSPYLADSNDWFLGDVSRQIVWGRVWDLEVVAQRRGSDADFERDVVQRYRASIFGGARCVDYRYVVKGSSD